jgi:hypothetical protein
MRGKSDMPHRADPPLDDAEDVCIRSSDQTPIDVSTERKGDLDFYAGQILDGAKAIARYLNHIGFTEMNERKVYHWAADGRIPVTKVGNRLVTNKRRVLRHMGIE